MRSIAAFPPDVPAPARKGMEMEYSFRTITPVFGGGVEVRMLDEQTPIRGTTVRGHLRFWWRATRGRAFTDYRQLRREEFAIWGDTETPSEVGVEVGVDGHGQSKTADTYVAQHPDLTYALFPFTQQPAGRYWEQLAFRIRVSYPKNRQADVEAALWGWSNFGGIGSRTRRGCGAIFCPTFAPANANETMDWAQQRLFSYLEIDPEKYDAGLRTWASIAYPPMVDRSHSGSPVESWKGVIRLLACYRQLPPVGRRGTPNQPRTYSRSNWPEADSLRSITGDGIPEHMESITTTGAFPRAELGLPYIIKFRSRTRDDRDSVNDCSILPLDSSRVASPLILRPLAFGPQGSMAVPAILLMSPYALSGVRIQFKRSSKELHGSHYVADPRLTLYPNSPLGPASGPLSPSGSAVEGFLAFAQEKGFQF